MSTPARKANQRMRGSKLQPPELGYDSRVIAARRSKLGLSYEEIRALCRPVKLSRQTVTRVCEGNVKVEIGNVLAVLSVLGLTLADVVIHAETEKREVA